MTDELEASLLETIAAYGGLDWLDLMVRDFDRDPAEIHDALGRLADRGEVEFDRMGDHVGVWLLPRRM